MLHENGCSNVTSAGEGKYIRAIRKLKIENGFKAVEAHFPLVRGNKGVLSCKVNVIADTPLTPLTRGELLAVWRNSCLLIVYI